VTCQSCGLALVDQYSTSIEVGQKNPLTVNQVEARSVGDGGVIYVHLSERVLADAIRPYITLSLATDYTVETEWSTVLIHGKFVREMRSMSKSPKGCRVLGHTLANDFSTRVKFPDLEPSVSLHLARFFSPSPGTDLWRSRQQHSPGGGGN